MLRLVRYLVAIELLVIGQPEGYAQIEDLAGETWAAPAYDAVERFREAPLCLPCVSATDLTVIPGIGRTASSRITRAVRGGVTNHADLADSACLTLDQQTLLFLCTTFDCSCNSFVNAVRSSTRVVASSSTSLDVLTRLDIATDVGRVGGLFRNNATGGDYSSWLVADAGPLTIGLGNVAIGGGLGVVHGSGSTFGSTPLARVASADGNPRLRPWTSAIRDGSLFGAGLVARIPVDEHMAHVMVFRSEQIVGNRHERSTHSSCTVSSEDWLGGINIQHILYDEPSLSTSMRTIREPSRLLMSAVLQRSFQDWNAAVEFATDNSARVCFVGLASVYLPKLQIHACARWAHPDIRNPYAAPTSSMSALGNEAGIALGVRFREVKSWKLDVTCDVHSILSRSFGRPLPSYGVDLLCDTELRLHKGLVISSRLRYEADDEGWRPQGEARWLQHTRYRCTFRSQLEAFPLRHLRLIARIDTRTVWFSLRPDHEFGILAYADVQYTPYSRLRFSIRTCAYRSPSLLSTAYAVENPLPGYLRTVTGIGEATRLLITARYNVFPWLTLSSAAWEVRPERNKSQLAAGVQIEIFYLNSAR